MENWEYIDKVREGPIIVFANNRCDKPISWLRENQHIIDETLYNHGGILLRGFDIHSLKEFNQFSMEMSPNLLEYVNRSTPRVKLGGNIYSATEYPSQYHIQLHNESSYSDSWPKFILFYCAIAPAAGGYTPIANSAKVLNHIDDNLVNRCKFHGVQYVRHYYPQLDLSWQEVYQKKEKSKVEAYCQEHAITYEWLSGYPELKTSQKRQAVLLHEKTNQVVWFNQAHLFNIYSFPEKVRELLARETKGLYSRNSYLGDGTEFTQLEIQNIIDAYTQEKIQFAWKRGDILILDNILMAHGRTPFNGDRKIAVSMY